MADVKINKISAIKKIREYADRHGVYSRKDSDEFGYRYTLGLKEAKDLLEIAISFVSVDSELHECFCGRNDSHAHPFGVHESL